MMDSTTRGNSLVQRNRIVVVIVVSLFVVMNSRITQTLGKLLADCPSGLATSSSSVDQLGANVKFDGKHSKVPHYVKPEPTYGLVVVHCKEANTSWLEEVPPDWRLVVFETCGKGVSPRASAPFRNAGSEECTGYFEYVIQNYHRLPDVSFFLQSDGLMGYGKPKPTAPHQITGHTPFSSIEEMKNVTHDKIVRQKNTKFINFGWPTQWKTRIVPDDRTYTWNYIPDLMFDLGVNFTDKTEVTSRPGACFAVTRERILARPRSLYVRLQEKILQSVNQSAARRRCCALENTWHILFGEPLELPVVSSVDDVYKQKSFS